LALQRLALRTVAFEPELLKGPGPLDKVACPNTDKSLETQWHFRLQARLLCRLPDFPSAVLLSLKAHQYTPLNVVTEKVGYST